jgi:uncharacterized protein YukE
MGTSYPDSNGPIHLVPSEAQHIANHFNRLAAEADRISESVESTGRRLSRTWVGRSRDAFFETFARHPAEFGNLSESIRRKANRIRSMHVVIWPGETGPS